MNEMEKENFLSRMQKIIQENPGIRPSELNRRLGKEHTNHYRNILIERGLVRKEKRTSSTHYFAMD